MIKIVAMKKGSTVLLPGKLPSDLLSKILGSLPIHDQRLIQGPGTGLDCAVIDLGERLLSFKSDPITFASDAIGWYAVQVNANDIVTSGAQPRWFLATLLLPDKSTTDETVAGIFEQVREACDAIGVTIIGGHTEITIGLDRPILCGTMIGEMNRSQLVRSSGAQVGDRILLTKGVPIEATAILARELPHKLGQLLSSHELREAQAYLTNPGISVLKDAEVATRNGRVTAMHDPTEGGIAGALWELAESSGCGLRADPARVPIPALAQRVCDAFGIDPLAAIASGSLLLTTPKGDAQQIIVALKAAGIECADLGEVIPGPAAVWRHDGVAWPRPERDEIARVFEEFLIGDP